MADTIISHSPSETWQAGESLARNLPGGAVVALCGDLGAGKTQFCRGLLAGLGGDPDEVTSPTFPLVHEYISANVPVFHFDFYRLESEQELTGIGWNDFLQADGILIVEWADKFPGSLPQDTRWVRFHLGEGSVRVLEVGS
jgi:tRNA threonylcarbamoyladenosine biosynthesis protein TsaE